jgi:hypothetical protein
MSARDAYYTAYDTKCNDNTAYNEAARILAKDEVQARLTELRRPIENQVRASALSEYDRIKALLWERIAICQETGDEAAIARYTDQLNKLNGSYTNVNHNINENKLDLSQIDVNALKRISSES